MHALHQDFSSKLASLLRAFHFLRLSEFRSLQLSLATLIAVSAVVCGFAPRAEAASSSIRVPGGGQLLLRSANLVRDFNEGTLELTGGVQIIYNGQYVSCDSAIVNEKTQEMSLQGNVVFSSTQAYMEGDSAVVNYKTNTGTFINAFVKSGQVIFEGKVVRKTGEKNYEAENGSFTACDTCPPAWTFSGTKLNAELGGYATIKNSILHIANFPVFWLPYLVVPLKSERQSGFLVPQFEFTSKNFAVGIPYFWAIDRSQDAMFTVKSYTQRGFKGLANYRYMLDDKSEGELNFGFIRDQTFVNDYQAIGIDVGQKQNRFFLTYDQKYDLPYGFYQKTKLAAASDLRYPRDFPLEMAGQGDPALENRVSLTRNTEATHASVDVDYYINQLKTDPTSSNSDAVHRWPELKYSVRDTPIGDTGLLYKLDIDYVNFARDGLAFDDMNQSTIPNSDGSFSRTPDSLGAGHGPNQTGRPGVFDPDVDLIRTGQRLDFRPEISMPFHAGKYIDILPSVQFRHTHYSFNISPGDDGNSTNFDPTPYRQYIRGEVSARTRFYRVFGGDSDDSANANSILGAQPPPVERLPADENSKGALAAPTNWSDQESAVEPSLITRVRPPTKYRHEFMPEVLFTGVPYFEQSGNSFFSRSSQTPAFLTDEAIVDTDLNSPRGLQFDYADRIINRNTVSLVLTNRLVKKSFDTDTPTYRQIASWKLGQTYDLDEAKKTAGPAYPWSNIYSVLDVRFKNIEANSDIRYFPYHRVANSTSRVRLMSGPAYFETSFAQTFQITDDIDKAGQNRTDDIGFAAGFVKRYLIFSGIIDLQRRNSPTDQPLAVASYGALLTFIPPGNCWGIKLKVEQALADDLHVNVDFDYKFGG